MPHPNLKREPHAMPAPYPAQPRARDQWILAQRAHAVPPAVPRTALQPEVPHLFFVEDECADHGEVVSVATLFLTNRECPWRCLMCDLWRNTLLQPTPRGAIPAQIAHALARLPAARHVKLYNSGSFFDQQAIPLADYGDIAAQVRSFERVIVECHAALVGQSSVRFRDLLCGAPLEVAIGLETAHPQVLAQLNKRTTLGQFAAAAKFLRDHAMALRVFILVKPPFLNEVEALYWAERSLDFAFDCGASVATLIPTRFNNGALEALAARGDFSPPQLATVEAAMAYGLAQKRGRVLVDLWDLQRCHACAHCRAERTARLHQMNLQQTFLPRGSCAICGVSCEGSV